MLIDPIKGFVLEKKNTHVKLKSIGKHTRDSRFLTHRWENTDGFSSPTCSKQRGGDILEDFVYPKLLVVSKNKCHVSCYGAAAAAPSDADLFQ